MSINAAPGMRERPLQVGDWVELADTIPRAVSTGITRMLESMQWPQKIAKTDGAFPVFEGHPCDPARFRRVEPPFEKSPLELENQRLRDEVATLQSRLTAELDATSKHVKRINELVKRCDELADTKQERDEAREYVKAYEQAVKDYEEADKINGKAITQLREQLATAEKRAGTVSPRGVDRGFACGRHYLQVAGVTVAVEGDACRDSTLAGLWDMEKIDSVCDKARAIEVEANATIHGLIAERNNLSDQLATVQAEAAAMREALQKCYTAFGDETIVNGPKNGQGLYTGICVSASVALALDGTAGRDLLDQHDREIADRDAEIAQLRARLETPAEEPKPASETEWVYRSNGPALFRFDGNSFSVRSPGLGWVKPITYFNWQACCDDPGTYPCSENGERIIPTTSDMPFDDLKPDAELCRKLRALLHEYQDECGIYSIGQVHIGCRIGDGAKQIADTLIAIRDSKGGA